MTSTRAQNSFRPLVSNNTQVKDIQPRVERRTSKAPPTVTSTTENAPMDSPPAMRLRKRHREEDSTEQNRKSKRLAPLVTLHTIKQEIFDEEPVEDASICPSEKCQVIIQDSYSLADKFI